MYLYLYVHAHMYIHTSERRGRQGRHAAARRELINHARGDQ